MNNVAFVCCILYCWSTSAYAQDKTTLVGSHEYRVFHKLLGSGYNKYVRPVTNINETVIVTMNPAVYSVLRTDEAGETITVAQWMRMFWNDEYLYWDPAEYGGLKKIKIPLNQIWSPDLVIHGMLDVSLCLSEEKTLAEVDHTGNISVYLTEIATVHCKYNIQSYPFDKQNCSFHYGSWMYDGKEVFWRTLNPYGDSRFFQSNTEWILESFNASTIEVFYSSSPLPFIEVFYHIVMKRKPLYYIFTIFLPTFTITTLSLVGLFTPFSAGGDRQEKITLGLTTLLAMAILLIMVSDQMPKTSDGLPMIGVFLMFELMVTTVSCICAVGIMYIHHRSAYGSSVPDFLYKITCLAKKPCKPPSFTAAENKVF